MYDDHHQGIDLGNSKPLWCLLRVNTLFPLKSSSRCYFIHMGLVNLFGKEFEILPKISWKKKSFSNIKSYCF